MKYRNYKICISLKIILILTVFLSVVGYSLFFSIKNVILGGFSGNGTIIGVDIVSVNNIIMKTKNIIIIETIILILVVTSLTYKLSADKFRALYMDYLTEMKNKRFYDINLERYVKEFSIIKRPLSIMMIDIDSFKQINDTYGHDIGDMVLQHVAKILKTNIRESDSCCRFGGDEFVVILPDADVEQAKIIGERIIDKLKYYPFVLDKNNLKYINVTVSMGIAEWNGHISADKFSKCADDALYISKSMGKDKITVYE